VLGGRWLVGVEEGADVVVVVALNNMKSGRQEGASCIEICTLHSVLR
jgi:hypothetical protein